jgi:flagellar biosynthesis regulator FlaF
MRKSIVLLMLFVCVISYSQEFKVYDNGLIYSEATVGKLKHIVDSLNLKFKSCEPKQFNVLKQCKAIFVSLSKRNVKEAKKDIENNLSFDEFVKKYPKAVVRRDNLVIGHENFDKEENKKRFILQSVELGDYADFEFYLNQADYVKKYNGIFKNKWVFEYNEKTEYSDESIDALYFIEELSSKKLSDKYAQNVQYSECLIDTTSQIFLEKAKYDSFRYYDTLPNKVSILNNYVEKVLNRPEFGNEKFEILYGLDTLDFDSPKRKLSKKELAKREKLQKEAEKDFEVFRVKVDKWESQRLSRMDSLKNNDANFMKMLKDALGYAKDSSRSNDDFEELVARYISKEDALFLKRNRRVVGGCSMDLSPRYHAVNIAVLSAETTKWDVFLKSHLNIMNDRFDRVSDGSWSQASRNTYIKELEELNINVVDLLLGTSFRIDNPVGNHYYADIGRLGRALSESKDREVFEKNILDAIEDDGLDDYNRIIMYYLFKNYNHFIKDEIRKQNNLTRLKATVRKLPEYLSQKIKFES